jgi:hypothetical protein
MKTYALFFIFCFFLLAKNTHAQPDYKLIDPFFKKYIEKNGKVDFKNLKKNIKELDATLAIFTQNAPKEDWHRNERLAYWLNVYNLQFLKIVAEKYPVNNILDIHNGKLWQVKCIVINGRSYCLDEIENEIIRKDFNEPRIHFALFSAAVSSPPILNQVFTPGNMNNHFEELTKKFINSKNNKITNTQLDISPVFKWYAADFKDVVAFLSKYSGISIRPDAQINYNEYDWTLR